MSYEATGILYKKFEAEQITERFRKREFVVTIGADSRWPQHVSFQLTGDRCEELDPFNEGDEVQVEFSLRGREWTSRSGDVKYFNSLDVRTIQRLSAAPPMDDDRPPLPDGPPADFSDDEVPF